MKAVIICNGNMDNYIYYNKYLEGAGLIICADGGAAHARKLGIIPHILMGDFDSINKDDYRYFEDKGVAIKTFPAEKDMTDAELAVSLALEKGCSEIVLIGAAGSRLDHSLANILLLKTMLDRGVKGYIANETNEITLIRDKIELDREEGVRITLLPLSERVEGVTTRGLHYPLVNATMPMGTTWGVSNEFSEDRAEVTLSKGVLIVIKSRE